MYLIFYAPPIICINYNLHNKVKVFKKIYDILILRLLKAIVMQLKWKADVKQLDVCTLIKSITNNSNGFTQIFIKYRTGTTSTQLANEESIHWINLKLNPFVHWSIKLNYFTENYQY